MMTIKSRMAVALFALLAYCAPGEEVSSDVAEDAARGWINLREALGEEITAEPDSVISYDAKDGKGKYYVVNLKGGGFVVTSGDTEIEPILAYSKDSTWNTNATQNPLMVMLNIDVAAMMVELGSANAANAAGTTGGRRLAAAAPSAKATKWARLRSAASAKGGARLQAGSLSSLGDVRVNTLMETKWGQSGHGENQYTPRGYVCGCVATAGAQIMRYWRYPTASITKIKDYYGTVDGAASWTLNDGYQTAAGGSYTPWNDDVKTFGGTYDWNNMPATFSWSMSTAQKKAIGKLTLDVGRSVYMDYADDGSGAHYSLIATRLVDQFQYKNAALIIKKDGCSLDEIKRAILPSLDLKSPCGVSVPGHAIVADGYGYNSGTLYVHFNLGWTGTDNAWYNPPDLTDANSKFTSIDTIIYNIYPPSVCSDSGRSILSGRVLNSSGNKVANATVTARKGSSTYQATTDSNGIYAILVPAGTYTVQSSNNGVTASTNVTVASTVSTRLSNETGSSYYPTSPTPVVGNVYGVELTLNQLPAPTFSRANTVTDTTIFDGYVNLTISSSVSGATIRYTLDGSDPTSSSTAYSGALQISSTCTVKARAFKSGYLDSEVAEITFNKLSPTGDLILNGGFEQNTVTQNSGVWSYSNGDGFSCKYWTFASNAGLAAPNSTWVANHSDFGGKAAFIQTNGAGSESFVAQEFVIPNAATYDFKFTYAARPGYVGVTTHVLLIRGSVTNEIASVSPSATSPSEYSGQVSVNAAATHILRFVQTGVSGDKANIIDNVTFQMAKLPEPTFSPAPGSVITDSVDITLACATAGATIRYTLDGSEPTSSSAAYSAPITINGTTTIKAKVFKSGYVESDTVSATYIFADQAAPPTSTSTAGYRTTLVDLASTIPGAVIRYTTDGSDPTEQSEVYTAGTSINVTNATGATTIKARVYAEGYRPSDVFSYDYYVKQFFGPTNGVNAAVWEDTPQNRADHWIFENEEYQEATGLWSNAVEYVNHKVAIEEGNEFTADNPSAGRNVTIETTASFNSAAEENQEFTGVKAAVRIGTNACFQVYTTNLSGRVWLDTEGFTAIVGNDYTLRVEMDMTNRMYSVSVKQGVDYLPLTIDGKSTFPFAYDDVTPYVQKVGYVGEGAVGSIYGSYTNRVVVFRVDDIVTGSDGTNTTLTAAQAEWLNARGNHEAVEAMIRTLTSDQFARAYLLNEDVMSKDYNVDNWGSFKITSIEVGEDKITVKVRLLRNFAVMDGSKPAPINGTLTIYGGTDVTNISTQIQNYELNDNDEHFRDSADATYKVDKGAIKFYKAKIR
ncbi:MAG: chitobiase/beta-hexosaminidase C-terminal domain-containing protein [Kiritimatiellae bacterium]|nr:chitobiase/beta-hexosaminidase C-terminal domain-containing protein [Kiritimatiellia bacterium]